MQVIYLGGDFKNRVKSRETEIEKRGNIFIIELASTVDNWDIILLGTSRKPYRMHLIIESWEVRATTYELYFPFVGECKNIDTCAPLGCIKLKLREPPLLWRNP